MKATVAHYYVTNVMDSFFMASTVAYNEDQKHFETGCGTPSSGGGQKAHSSNRLASSAPKSMHTGIASFNHGVRTVRSRTKKNLTACWK